MRRRALLLLAGLFCLCAAAAEPVVLDAASSQLRVVDGDSINYGSWRFRLCGIQAPEYRHPLYRRTTAMLGNLLGRGKITAHVVDIDKYQRQVVVLFAGGQPVSVNEAMVRQGGARHYTRYSANCAPFISQRQFVAAEQSARRYRRGIWLNNH